MTSDPMLGRVLAGKVEIVASLGAGGMARVYRGWHRELRRAVAIKVLPPGNDKSEFVRRLYQEVAAAKKIDHPNVVQMYEAGVDPVDGTVYVFMEYVEGRDLAQLLSGKRRLSVSRACKVMVSVAEALTAAHSSGVLHRDVKPGNIMLTRTTGERGFVDVVKLVDFGLAKFSGTDAAPLTTPGIGMGTLGFISPEQAMGEPLDERTDVYACGATLYRLLMGQVPFPGQDLGALLRAAQSPPPPLDVGPPELERVVRWALAPHRDDRLPSAKVLAEHLQPFVGYEGSPSRPPITAMPPPIEALPPEEKPSPPVAATPGALPLFRIDLALGRPASMSDMQDAVSVETPGEDTAPELIAAQGATAPRSSAPRPSGPTNAARPVVEPPPRWGAAGWRGLVVGALSAAVLTAGGLWVRGRMDGARAMGHELAVGSSIFAEAAFFQDLEHQRTGAFGRRVAARLLAERRTNQNHLFDPRFQLAPSTWVGSAKEPVSGGDQPFTLKVLTVDPPWFTGELAWAATGAHLEVVGVTEGNQLLFTETAAMGRAWPDYPYLQRKSGFIVQQGLETLFAGTDGPFRAEFLAKREGEGPTSHVVRLPTASEVGTGVATDEEVTAFLAWKTTAVQLEHRAYRLSIDLGRGVLTAEQGTAALDEIAAKRRAIADSPPPLSGEQRGALEQMVRDLFVVVPGQLPKARDDERQREANRLRYGATWERLLARQTELFEAWAPPR